MHGLASRAEEMRRSAIRVVFDAAEGQADLIRLEIGEPSFPTPPHVVEAANAAARAGFTKYTANGGFPSLRKLLAEKVERINGYGVSADQVVATPGGMNALFSTYLALLNPGDEVLLPSPGFPNMDEMVRLVGGQPRFYPLRRENGYRPVVGELDALVTPKTRVLFINTPGNPTGAVFSAGLVEELVAFARRRDLWLIADEVYDQLVLDDDLEHVSAGRFDTDQRVVSVYSFSKVYAMTGWRLGYAVAPPAVADTLRKLQEPQLSCPSAISQKAAEAALTGPQDVIEIMRRAYQQRRDRAWEAIRDHDLGAYRTEGTFYMLIDVSPAGLPSMDFTMQLLKTGRVSVAPGEVFGPAGQGLIRISMAIEAEPIVEGIRRIASAVHGSGEARGIA
jgi:aspartate/methionine/tyrosine aminotransferase